MKPNQKSPLNEVARLSGLEAASEQAGTELSRFIDFIQRHNLDLDRAAATIVASCWLHGLPSLFLENPELMEMLRAIATEFQS